MVSKSQSKTNGQQNTSESASEDVAEVLPQSVTGAVTGDVAVGSKATFTDEVLKNVTSMDEAIRLLGGSDNLVDSRELGSGFELVKDKDQFCEKPLLFVQWRFVAEGNYGEFAVCHVMDKDNNKSIFVDGGTGVYQQLRQLTDTDGRTSGLLAQRGLTRSDYTFTDPNTGRENDAKTYYIAL